MADFDITASRATEPLFFEAPYPEWGPYRPSPYQHAGVEYRIGRKHALFGDAPGLGKSCEAILYGNAIQAKYTLIVCPASLRLNWEREIRLWSNIENRSIYPILRSKDGVSLQHNFVIISYDLLRNKSIVQALLDDRWDHLILDEAHALKDPKGNQRTKVICAPDMLPSVVDRITMLSGTILPNQPIECFGADTLVLTNGGWKCIVEITTNDLVWDGVEWVKHGGLIHRGLKRIIDLGGVSVTPDHILLSGRKWRTAASLAQDENFLSQALATGSENLPSFTSQKGQEAALSTSGAGVLAEDLLLPFKAWERCTPVALASAGAAVLKRVLKVTVNTVSTPQYVQTLSIGRDCCRGSQIFSSDATTQTSLNFIATEAGGLGCMNPGVKAGRGEDSFSSTLFHLLGGTSLHGKLIALMSAVGTSRGTSASQRERKERNAKSEKCKSVSENWKSVYDLMNAGPRQRFTILTNKGPLIAHNCYNAVRLLNWDAIDRMSLDAFREEYYEEGGGMVRSPVLITEDKFGNPCEPYYVSKVHWSDSVRNVPVNLDDLQWRLRKYVMVRRRKEQVLTQLPPKQWHPFPLESTVAIRKALKHPGWKTVEKLFELGEENFDLNVPVDGAVSTALRELGEAKAPSVANYIEELLEEGVEKILVAAWHRNTLGAGVDGTGKSVLHYLRDRLSKYGLAYMDGGTTPRNKQQAVDDFQEREDIRVILGQLSAIGEGWTLTKAQDAVFAEFYWVPGKNDQLLDRLHRRGQKGSYVIGHVPLAAGSMDERVIGMAVKKDANIFDALDREWKY